MKKRKLISKDSVKEVVHLLKTTDLSLLKISQMTNVGFSSVKAICYGNRNTDITGGAINRPLVDPLKWITPKETVLRIIDLLKNTNLSHSEISKSTGASKATIAQINIGKSYKNLSGGRVNTHLAGGTYTSNPELKGYLSIRKEMLDNSKQLAKELVDESETLKLFCKFSINDFKDVEKEDIFKDSPRVKASYKSVIRVVNALQETREWRLAHISKLHQALSQHHSNLKSETVSYIQWANTNTETHSSLNIHLRNLQIIESVISKLDLVFKYLSLYFASNKKARAFIKSKNQNK